MYEFLTGKITKDPVYADKYKRLFDKGYIAAKGELIYVNMIVTALSQNDFCNMLPAMPETLKSAGKELDAEIYKINKKLYPSHMQDLCRAQSQNCLSNNSVRTRVLEQLTSTGMLKPLTEHQKHSVNTIMFCDVLPKQ